MHQRLHDALLPLYYDRFRFTVQDSNLTWWLRGQDTFLWLQIWHFLVVKSRLLVVSIEKRPDPHGIQIVLVVKLLCYCQARNCYIENIADAKYDDVADLNAI